MGIGSPDPPQFIYDDDEYQDVFLSGKLQVICSCYSSELCVTFVLSGSVNILCKTAALKPITIHMK